MDDSDCRHEVDYDSLGAVEVLEMYNWSLAEVSEDLRGSKKMAAKVMETGDGQTRLQMTAIWLYCRRVPLIR